MQLRSEVIELTGPVAFPLSARYVGNPRPVQAVEHELAEVIESKAKIFYHHVPRHGWGDVVKRRVIGIRVDFEAVSWHMAQGMLPRPLVGRERAQIV